MPAKPEVNEDTMYTDLSDIVIEKTITIFEELFKERPVSGAPSVVNERKPHKWDISGFSAVAGSMMGAIAIRLTDSLADKLLVKSKLEQYEHTEKWRIINDMVAEIVNTLAGNVLTESGGDNPKLSVPITVTGKEHIISHPKNNSIVCIPFSLSLGRFEIEYSLTLVE